MGVTRPSSSGQGGTCIDNFYIKTNSISTKAYKITNPFNDHFPLFVQINNINFIRENKKLNRIVNYKKLKNIAQNMDWNTILSLQEPNRVTDEIITRINYCVERATTERKQKNSDRDKIPRKKWITKAIIVSCKKKEFLYSIWQKHKESFSLKKEYMDYCKVLNRVIKDAKIMYERDRINENANDQKKLWKIINEKMGKRKKAENKIKHICINGNTVANKTEIANIMNNFYCKVGKNLSKQIKKPTNLPKEIERNSKSIFLYPTNAEEVIKIIKQLKNKAGGEDKINAKTLKTIE